MADGQWPNRKEWLMNNVNPVHDVYRDKLPYKTHSKTDRKNLWWNQSFVQCSAQCWCSVTPSHTMSTKNKAIQLRAHFFSEFHFNKCESEKNPNTSTHKWPSMKICVCVLLKKNWLLTLIAITRRYFSQYSHSYLHAERISLIKCYIANNETF